MDGAAEFQMDGAAEFQMARRFATCCADGAITKNNSVLTQVHT